MMPKSGVVLVHWGGARFRGSERVAEQIARGLVARGRTVALWTNQRELIDRLDAVGVASELAPISGFSGLPRALAQRDLISEGKRLGKLARRTGAKVLFVNNASPVPLALAASLLSGPCFVHVHLHTRYRLTDQLRHAMWMTDGITSVSRFCVSNLRFGCEDRFVQVIPNGAEDPEPGSHAPTENSALRVVVCGELVASKRVDACIEAIRVAKRLGADVELTVVGDGPELKRLASLASGLPVHFAGWVANPQSHYRDADLVLSACTSEAFGLTLIEGAAAGLASIAPSIGGPAEIIEHGITGYLVSAGSYEQEVGTLLLNLANDRLHCRRLGIAARARFEKFFREDSMIDEFDRLIANRYDAAQPKLRTRRLGAVVALPFELLRVAAAKVRR